MITPPIRGNIYTNDFTGNNIRYVRVRAFATNPAILGGDDFIQLGTVNDVPISPSQAPVAPTD